MQKFFSIVPVMILSQAWQKYRHDVSQSVTFLKEFVGQTHEVLIEGFSKKSANDFAGKNDQNAVVVFPVVDSYKKGEYVQVLIESCTSATLIGKIVN